MTVPDEGRPGWYVRLKIHPNRTIEKVGSFPAYDLEAAKRVGDMNPEDLVEAASRKVVSDQAFTGLPDRAAALKGIPSALRLR